MTDKLFATLQVMFQNRTGKLALVDLYYEWGRGRNANLIHAQQGTTLYDIGAALSSAAKPILPIFFLVGRRCKSTLHHVQ